MARADEDRRRPDEIEHDIADTRAEIDETLDAIERKLSPGQLLDQALGYYRLPPGTASRVGELIKQNPLPVALIGVGLAWLAFSAQSGGRRARHYSGEGYPAAGGTDYYGYDWPTQQAGRDAVMAVSRENLAAWLRDAHAMEQQAIEMMEKMERRLEHYPEMRTRLRQHLDETHRQAERVERCLELLGTSTSSVKDIGAKLVGTGQALSGLFVSDEVVKGGIANQTFEHYEIASYQALIATAEEAGELEVARLCEENLREEEAMANWLADHLPQVTRQYLHRAAAGEVAKH